MDDHQLMVLRMFVAENWDDFCAIAESLGEDPEVIYKVLCGEEHD